MNNIFVFVIVLTMSFASIQASASLNLDPTTMKIVTKQKQSIESIPFGIISLAKRLELINNAQSSIAVESFVYNTDTSGRLISQALVRKAQEGVNVRVLIDSSSRVLQLNEYFVEVLSAAGVQVKYYNPFSLNFSS